MAAIISILTMESEKMHRCLKCSEYGFEFNRNYKPTEYIEGYANSQVWIIGLNPAIPQGADDNRNAADLEAHLLEAKTYQYFKDFGKLLPELHEHMGLPYGVATTEIVKCFSKKFPKGKCGRMLIGNCKNYLREQIVEHKPKLIICSGSEVSRYIEAEFPSEEEQDNAYIHTAADISVGIVLSGYVKYMDVYSRRRLSKDVDKMISKLNINFDSTANDLAA